MNRKTYEDIFQELKEMSCLIHSESKSNHRVGHDIFFVRGCRYSLRLNKVRTWDVFTGVASEHITIKWYFKTKKFKKKLEPVSFEDVLDSRHISGNAKVQLAFNIDLFRG